MSHRRSFLPAALAAIGLSLACATPAEALQFGTSSTTGKSVVLVPLRSGGHLAGPVGYTLGVRFTNALSDLLGPSSTVPTVFESSMLFDADLALNYRYQLLDVNFLGRFNPSIAPFLGYRYLGALTSAAGGSSISNAAVTAGLAQLHGPHFGIGADTELPLGFSAYGHAGTTLLTGGGWDVRRNSFDVTGGGKIDPTGALLPIFGVGAAWSLGPVFRIAVGYDLFVLPTNMRAQAAMLGGARTMVNNLTVGVNLGGFSF